jgi:hypothetical protein
MAKISMRSRGGRRGAWSADDIETLLRRFHKIGTEMLTKPSAGEPVRAQDSGAADRFSGYSPIHLRECRRFAQAYTRPELESLLKQRTQNGTPLAWGVVRQLMAVKNKTQRMELELRAVNEGWSAIRAATHLQERVFKKKRSEGARPFAEPRDLAELLRQVERHLDQTRRRCAHWTGSEVLKKPPTNKVGKGLETHVSRVRDELKSGAREFSTLAKLLESIISDESKAEKEPSAPAADSESRRK